MFQEQFYEHSENTKTYLISQDSVPFILFNSSGF